MEYEDIKGIPLTEIQEMKLRIRESEREIELLKKEKEMKVLSFEDELLSFSTIYNFINIFNLIYKNNGLKLNIIESPDVSFPYSKVFYLSIFYNHFGNNYGLCVEINENNFTVYNLSYLIKLLIELYHKKELELLDKKSDGKVYFFKDESGKLHLSKYDITLGRTSSGLK